MIYATDGETDEEATHTDLFLDHTYPGKTGHDLYDLGHVR